jgi:hypothetical protein
MIDYEKLKIAHELADKYSQENKIPICIEYSAAFGCQGKDNVSCFINYDRTDLHDLDSLITKLKELTAPTLAYKEGDKVWFISTEGGYGHDDIDAVCKDDDHPYFINEERWYKESELYPTKAALIEAIITYWQSQREAVLEPGIGGTSEPLKTYPAYKDPITDCDEIDCYHENNGRCEHNMPADDCFRCRLFEFHNNECQHESDTYSYITNHSPREHSRKCIKCGEFYK